MSDKDSAQDVIDSYRKRRQNSTPFLIGGVAVLLIVIGIVALVLWLTGGSGGGLSYLSSLPHPDRDCDKHANATATVTPTATSTATETVTRLSRRLHRFWSLCLRSGRRYARFNRHQVQRGCTGVDGLEQ
jgi:hypothetical protein